MKRNINWQLVVFLQFLHFTMLSDDAKDGNDKRWKWFTIWQVRKRWEILFCLNLHIFYCILLNFKILIFAEIFFYPTIIFMNKAVWFLLFNMHILYYHTLLHRFPSKSQLSIILTHQTWISVKYGAYKVNNSNQQLLR